MSLGHCFCQSLVTFTSKISDFYEQYIVISFEFYTKSGNFSVHMLLMSKCGDYLIIFVNTYVNDFSNFKGDSKSKICRFTFFSHK